MVFTFPASTTTAEGKEASLPFASTLWHQYLNNKTVQCCKLQVFRNLFVHKMVRNLATFHITTVYILITHDTYLILNDHEQLFKVTMTI